MLEVVAGVVLAQGLQPVPDPPVGEHHFEPEHQVAGIAIGEHGGSAGIGGEVASDPAGAFRGQREREQETCLGRGGLDIGEGHAGLHGDGRAQGIEAAHTVEAHQRQHDAAFGHAAADEAGIAALRHDRHPCPGAGLDHEGDLGGIGGADQCESLTPVEPAHLHEGGSHDVGIGEDVLFAKPAGEDVEKRRGRGHAGSPLAV